MSLNVCAIIGRLADVPEVRQTNSGKSVCSFSVAVDRMGKRDENAKPDWIDCVAWDHSADYLHNYGKKGRLVSVSGRLQTRSFEDKNGNKRKVTELVASDVSFLDRSEEQAGGYVQTVKPAEQKPAPSLPAFRKNPPTPSVVYDPQPVQQTMGWSSGHPNSAFAPVDDSQDLPF